MQAPAAAPHTPSPAGAAEVGGPPAVVGESLAAPDACQALEEQRRLCESQGRYLEADAAARQLETLKVLEEGRRKQLLQQKQVAEKTEVASSHSAALAQLEAQWGGRLSEWERQAGAQEYLVAGRQAREVRELEQRQLQRAFLPKFSPQLLNLRAMQAALARQRDYERAAQLKAKADRAEARELEELHKVFQDRLSSERLLLVERHARERQAWANKTQNARLELLQQRQADLARLERKYQASQQSLHKSQARASALFASGLQAALGTHPCRARLAGGAAEEPGRCTPARPA